MKNYYRILDIPETADRTEIERAYTKIKELILKNSVSLYSILSAGEKDTLSKEIEEAYQTLIIPEKRSVYDLQLKGFSPRPQTDEIEDSISQLTFEFARDRFTYIDSTQIKHKIYKQTLNQIKNDYLLRSRGISIRLVESQEPSSDKGLIDETDTLTKDIHDQGYSELEDPSKKIVHKSAQMPDSDKIEYNGDLQEREPISNDQSEDMPKATSSAGTETPPLDNNTESRETIIIDENSEFSGEFIRRIRESMGITIKDIAHTTKISTTNIKNIEEENYKELPALVYVKGYLTQIAKCLKLRPDLVTRSYLSRMNERQKKGS